MIKMMDEDYHQMIQMMDAEKMGEANIPVRQKTMDHWRNSGPHLSKLSFSLLIVACCMSLAVLFGASHAMVRNTALRNIAVLTGFDELFSSLEEDRKLYLRNKLGHEAGKEEDGKQSSDVGNEVLELFLTVQQESATRETTSSQEGTKDD